VRVAAKAVDDALVAQLEVQIVLVTQLRKQRDRLRMHQRGLAVQLTLDCIGHCFSGADKVCDQSLIYVQHAFVFSQVAGVVAFVQYAPYLRAQAQGVGQYLKYDVPVG
jgi:hypothetical protein